MRATIEFNLPEEKDDVKIYMNAVSLYLFHERVFEILREHRKYGSYDDSVLQYIDQLESLLFEESVEGLPE